MRTEVGEVGKEGAGTSRRVRIAVLGIGFLVTSAMAADAKEISQRYDETFPVGSAARLRLDHGDGDVEIVPWDRPEIRVEVVYRASFTRIGWGTEPGYSVEFRQDGDEVHVIAREGGSHGVTVAIQTKITHEHRFTIHVPAHTTIDTRGDDGDLTITGLTGEVSCRLEDGDVELRDVVSPDLRVRVDDGDVFLAKVRGPLVLETDDGDISLVGCRSDEARVISDDGNVTLKGFVGSVSIRTEDGDVRLRDHESGMLEIRTDDGNVDVELVSGSRPEVEVDTADGRVRMTLATGVSSEILVATEDGRISVNLDAARIEESEHGIYAVIGDGDGSIRVRTQDGSVNLSRSSVVAP